MLGFDSLWIKRGPMKRFYQQYGGNKQKWNHNGKGKRLSQ